MRLLIHFNLMVREPQQNIKKDEKRKTLNEFLFPQNVPSYNNGNIPTPNTRTVTHNIS